MVNKALYSSLQFTKKPPVVSSKSLLIRLLSLTKLWLMILMASCLNFRWIEWHPLFWLFCVRPQSTAAVIDTCVFIQETYSLRLWEFINGVMIMTCIQSLWSMKLRKVAKNHGSSKGFWHHGPRFRFIRIGIRFLVGWFSKGWNLQASEIETVLAENQLTKKLEQLCDDHFFLLQSISNFSLLDATSLAIDEQMRWIEVECHCRGFSLQQLSYTGAFDFLRTDQQQQFWNSIFHHKRELIC